MSDKKIRTRVALVLDQSHSMQNIIEEAVGFYNDQVKILQGKAADGQEILVSLVTFCGEVYEHLWDVPAQELKLATIQDYTLGDWTAMRDAVGFTIKKLMDTADPNDTETATLVVVISDGQTNRDKIFGNPSNYKLNNAGISALKELIAKAQGTGTWTITYMGCDKDYMLQTANETGIPMANMAVWEKHEKTQAQRGLSSYSSRADEYFNNRSKGVIRTCNFASSTADMAMFTGEENTNTANNATVVPFVTDGGIIKAVEIPKPTTSPVIDMQYKSFSSHSDKVFGNRTNPVTWESSTEK